MRWLMVLACSVGWAQEFEVASIKASAPLVTRDAVRIAPRTGGPGTNDPTHLTWPSATLQAILLTAYDLKTYQLNAPEWMRTERFDISVAMAEGTTKEQLAAMWRNLLAARFGVKVRIEKKEFQVDDLVVGPRGHKLKETADPNAAAFTAVGNSPFDKDGNLNGAGLVTMFRMSPAGISAQMRGKAQAMAALANSLSGELGHPVMDKSGLNGRYDFSVDFAPGDVRLNGLVPPGGGNAQAATPVAPEVGMDLATAVQQQLGLRLEKGKGMLDYVVVEKAEKTPTEN